MKYIKTPDLWNQSTLDALTKGNLKLQSGQWVYAGCKDHPSRFVGISRKSGTIYAAHWQGSHAATLRRYDDLRHAVAAKIS